MVNSHSDAIDLQFQPASYIWPMDAEKELLVHVKGAARRVELQRLIDDGRLTEIPEFLTQAALSDDERSAAPWASTTAAPFRTRTRARPLSR